MASQFTIFKLLKSLIQWAFQIRETLVILLSLACLEKKKENDHIKQIIYNHRCLPAAVQHQHTAFTGPQQGILKQIRPFCQ